jgi:hypothetical protein
MRSCFDATTTRSSAIGAEGPRIRPAQGNALGTGETTRRTGPTGHLFADFGANCWSFGPVRDRFVTALHSQGAALGWENEGPSDQPVEPKQYCL